MYVISAVFDIDMNLFRKNTKSGMTVVMMELITCLLFGRTSLPDDLLLNALKSCVLLDRNSKNDDSALHMFLFKELLGFRLV